MVLSEEMKVMPFGDVWQEYLTRQGLCGCYLDTIRKYENEVLLKR